MKGTVPEKTASTGGVTVDVKTTREREEAVTMEAGALIMAT
jgi:hypothetical protein